MLWEWDGWGAERANGIAPHSFPLVMFSCVLNARNGNCERGYKGKLIQMNQIKVVEGVFPLRILQWKIII